MKRIIPRLDIKGPNLVKGINLEDLRVLGDPSIVAQYYAENGADELIFQEEKRANAVALASILHYYCIENLSEKFNFISSEFEGNKSFLKAFQKPKKFKSLSMNELKQDFLINQLV